MAVGSLCVLFGLSVVYSVPPEICFDKFRWDDCGQPATPVVYFWKPGSRCEIGLWRGCLPNNNMFRNEYECVSTCIFASRVRSKDYHELNELDDLYAEIQEYDMGNFSNDTNGSNGSDNATSDDGNGSNGSNGTDEETTTAAE